MKRFKYPVAIWRNKEEGHTYAFPLGAKDQFGDEIFPTINDLTWEYKCTLPEGVPVTDVKPDNGNRVKCKLNGQVIYTGSWGIVDDEGSRA